MRAMSVLVFTIDASTVTYAVRHPRALSHRLGGAGREKLMMRLMFALAGDGDAGVW